MIPQVLPHNENSFKTGGMGDCVCVVVLYNRQADGSYADAKGYHGGGGIGNVNFDALFHGVPNEAAKQIVMLGTRSGEVFAVLESTRQRIRQEANDHGLGMAYLRAFHGAGAYKIDRRGNVTPY